MSILMSCLGLVKIKLYGAQIILNYPRLEVLLRGTKSVIIQIFQISNWLGVLLM